MQALAEELGVAGREMANRDTMHVVARRAGVSVSTVSRALGGVSGVAPATRQRVWRIANDMGYVPNGAASGLATKRFGVLGLVFADLDDPSADSGHETLLYSDEVIRGAERAARRAGLAVVIAATHYADGPELVRSVAAKVDGLVVIARSVGRTELQRLARRVPVVLLAGRRRIAGIDFVQADNEGGGYGITSHLIRDHGYEDLVFVGGPSQSPDSGWRFKGFQRALADANIEVPRAPYLDEDFTEAGGWRAARRLLDRDEAPPRGIVVSNDQMAVGLVLALMEGGYSVPTDVAVTGFDDVQISRLVQPPLTTVHQPMRELGERSVELLLSRLGEPGRRCKSILLPTEVVVRQSCGCKTAGSLRVVNRRRDGEVRSEGARVAASGFEVSVADARSGKGRG